MKTIIMTLAGLLALTSAATSAQAFLIEDEQLRSILQASQAKANPTPKARKATAARTEPRSRQARASRQVASVSTESITVTFGSLGEPQFAASTETRFAGLGETRNAGPRPGKWCGWWMRTQFGGGPELNIAWNWTRYGSPASPQVGAIVVWRHHVGIITGQSASGQWVVKSGNDSGAVRERPRSVAGAVFRI